MTVTSFQRSARFVGLLDELEKISEASSNGEKFKRWAKNTAIIAGGVGTATVATMAADKALGGALGKAWSNASPKTKMLIVGPLLGLTAIGGHMAASKRGEEAHRRMHE